MSQANETRNGAGDVSSPDIRLGQSRRGLVYLLGLVIIGGHLWDNAFSSEHWPFSRYQMYSYMPEVKQLSKFRLYGVTEQGEVVLNADEHFAPFTMARLDAGLRKMLQYPIRSPEMTESLNGFLTLYERGRQEGRHDLPPLKALRIYKVKWKLDPWARNVGKPDKRVLLLEVKTNVQ